MLAETMWDHIFVVDLPILEKIIRPILVYVFLIVGLRLAGKRELAQLNTFDLIVLLTLSNTVQNAIIGNDNSLSGGLIGATALLAVNALFVRFMYSHEKLERLVEGEECVLIENGQLKHDALKCELITVAELEVAAHKQGIGNLAEVDRAVLEPGGVISFIVIKPEPEELRQTELLARLDDLDRKLSALQAARP
jgi:uncharacterized membrane protein YcaP (DUF421 family)